MWKRNSIQLLCLVILCSALVFTSSCGARSSAEPTEMIGSIYISMDIPTANSVADMVQMADVVIVGQYVEEMESYNKNRDPKDPTKEAIGSQHIGRIYRFCVHEVLKGEVMEESIEISIPYSTTRSYRAKAVDYTYVDPRFMEPELDTEYLLFLNYSENSGHYYGAGEPSAIKKGEDSSAELQSNLLERDIPFSLQGTVVDSDQKIAVTIDAGSIQNFTENMTFEQIHQAAKEESANLH